MFSAPLARSWRQTSVWALFPNVRSPSSFFNRALDMWKLVMVSLKLYITSQDTDFFHCGMQLLQQNGSTKAGCTVQSHVPNHSSAKTGPHQEELLSYFLQRALSLGSYLQENRYIWHGETFISTAQYSWTMHISVFFWKTTYHHLHIKIHTKNFLKTQQPYTESHLATIYNLQKEEIIKYYSTPRLNFLYKWWKDCQKIALIFILT